jgi:hypothetical protein
LVETDQQIGIERLFLKPAQHLSEDARRQLGRSTRARNHFGQTHRVSPFAEVLGGPIQRRIGGMLLSIEINAVASAQRTDENSPAL